MPEATSSSATLTPTAAARLLGLSVEATARLMAAGLLRCVDVGTGHRRHLRTSAAWVEAFRRGGQSVGNSQSGGVRAGGRCVVKGLEFAGSGGVGRERA